jgi:hypothetical protein
MDEKQRAALRVGARMDEVFAGGSIFEVSDAELQQFLQNLGSEGIPNANVQHRAVVRAVTINTVRSMRFFERVEQFNARLGVAVLLVGLASLAVAGFSIYQSQHTGAQLAALALQREAPGGGSAGAKHMPTPADIEASRRRLEAEEARHREALKYLQQGEPLP